MSIVDSHSATYNRPSIMATNVNKIRNPDFTEGQTRPRGWVWETTAPGARWQRRPADRPAGTAVMTIVSDQPKGTALWSRVVVCKPGEFYRVEATVTCDLSPAEKATATDGAGLVLAVQPMAQERPAGKPRVSPGLLRAPAPVAIRTYYEAPESIRRLRLSVGIVDACGTACIHHVRFIPILEPEELGHILAIPAPSHTVPAPRVAGSVSVCSRVAVSRPITRLLTARFGKPRVQTVLPAQLRSHKLLTDALLLPDAVPPPSLRSLAGLLRLTHDRIVVISLPAFAKLARGALSLRRVEQDDDPIHAKVDYANHATRGFALHDVFPFAWAGRAPGSFVQNHFRKTGALTAFCRRHDFSVLLLSVCNQDVTSDRPICLYKETPGGGLFVLDIEPAEAKSSTFGEPALAMYLLLSFLGQTQNSLGQYSSAVRKEADLRDLIRESALRFAPFMVHDANVPVAEVTEQLVTVGREDQAYSLPLKRKPLILVRSGLTSGQVESVYGAFVWFKQLVRSEPYVCPYAKPLVSQFRLAWVPCAAPWEARDGWRRSDQPGETVERRMSNWEWAISDSPLAVRDIAALIDIASSPINRVRIVLPDGDGAYERYVVWLPRLAATFQAGRYFAPSVGDGEAYGDRDRFIWRHVRHEVQVVVDPDAFQDEAHRDVIGAGGQVVRIEIPGSDADFTAHSIQRTDVAATLLEHVIGLQYGLIAVNRGPTAVHFDAVPPIAPGEALIVDRHDPLLRVDASQAG